MDIYSGAYLIFASGSFLAFSNDDDIKFEVAPNKDFHFSLIFHFVDDGGKSDLRKNVEENNMYFTCLNFNIGAGTTQPIEIATANGKKMFLHFWAEFIDTSKQTRQIKYTIYIEK